MQARTLAGGLLLALCGNLLAAPIYRWVDAQGITHFSAQPPAGQITEVISTASPMHAAPDAPDMPAGTQTDADQQRIDRQVRQQITEQELQRRQACEALRTNLAHLRNNPRLMVEENGKQRRLAEEERQQRITDTEKNIADHCR